jgi:hypothetical protein
LNAVLGRGAAAQAREGFEDLIKNGLDPLVTKYDESAKAALRLAEANARMEKSVGGIKNAAVEYFADYVEAYDRFKKSAEETPFGDGGSLSGVGTGLGVLSAAVKNTWIGKLLDRLMPEAPISDITPPQPTPPPMPEGPSAAEIAKRESIGGRFLQADYDAAMKTWAAATEKESLITEQKRLQKMLGQDYANISSDALQDAARVNAIITAELDKRNKDEQKAADERERLEERLAKIRENTERRFADVRERFAEAVGGIQVSMPRLTGLESVGGMLGGMGGAAHARAERELRIEQIQNDMREELRKIRETVENS